MQNSTKGVDMFFNRRTNRRGMVVWEISENVWFATKLRLYLTSHGAQTDITEDGSEVHIQVDPVTEITCCIMNTDNPTEVKTTTCENCKDGKPFVHFHNTFVDVLQYIRFMELFNGSNTRLYAKDKAFVETVNSATPPALSRNYYI